MKELEVAAGTATAGPIHRCTDFDVSKHVRFVPPFQETEVDKYLHFEKVASSLEWSKEYPAGGKVVASPHVSQVLCNVETM